MFELDWRALFVPTQSLLEIFLRGSVMYLALFLMLRFIVKREAGMLSITDVLVVVLIADAAQNGMAGEYQSITEGLVLVATILAWSYALDWIGFRSARLQHLIEPRPLQLIRRGRLLEGNMRKELISEEELMSKLRVQGYENLEDIKEAYMEGDGQISILPFERTGRHGPTRKRTL